MTVNAYFFSVFNDLDDFNFQGINTAKYFYDLWGAKDEVASIDLSAMKNRNQHDFMKNPVLLIAGFLKVTKILFMSRHKVIFFGNENRLIKTEETFYDLYNFNIIHDIGKANVLVLQDRHDAIKGKVYAPDLVIDDLTAFLFLFEKVLKVKFRKDIHAFKKTLGKKLAQIGFLEKASISKLLKFYARYLFYRFFLKVIKPKSAILICHYSKHAFVAACKRLGIPTIELQHGHILPIHRFYNIPDIKPAYQKQFQQSFIPDFIAVYGDYWGKNLIDGNLFHSEQIVNIGYYLKVDKQITSKRLSDKVTILITSNPPIQPDIIEYIHSIKSKLDPSKIRFIIKPHPLEEDRDYEKIVDGSLFILDRSDLFEQFSQADIHISIGSSTLLDALLFDVDNYVLFVDKHRDVCNEILNANIAKRLDMGQLPDLYTNKKINNNYFTDTYNIHELIKILPT